MRKRILNCLIFLCFISLNLTAQQIIRTNTSVDTPNEEPGAIRVSSEGLAALGEPVSIQAPQQAVLTAEYPISTNLFERDLVIVIVTGGIVSSECTPVVNNPNIQFIAATSDLASNSSTINFFVTGTGVAAGSTLEISNLCVGNIIQSDDVNIEAQSEIAGKITTNVVPSLEIQGVPTQNEMTVTYQVNVSIQDGDLVIFTFNGATLDSQNIPTLTDSMTSSQSLSFDEISNNTDGEILSSVLTFRAPSGGLAVDGFRNLVLSNVVFDRVVNPGEVVLSASTSVLETDILFNRAPPVAILDIRSQFALGSASSALNRQFNSVIDIGSLRQQFVAASDPGTVTDGSSRLPESIVRDDFFVSIDSAQTDLLNTVVTSAQISLTGEDLEFLLDVDGNIDTARFDVTGLNGATVEDSDEEAANLENNTLTITTANDPGGYVGIALLPEGMSEDNFTQLSPQLFSARVEVRYALAGETGFVDRNDIDAGAWSLNGATFNIPFMPYGPAFNQVIVLSNDSSVSASIELIAFNNEGEQIGPILLSQEAQGNTVTNITGLIQEALEDELGEGFEATGTEFDFTLYVDALSANVDLSANYRANNDRVGVIVIKE